jgi:hypothetical protein
MLTISQARSPKRSMILKDHKEAKISAIGVGTTSFNSG